MWIAVFIATPVMKISPVLCDYRLNGEPKIATVATAEHKFPISCFLPFAYWSWPICKFSHFSHEKLSRCIFHHLHFIIKDWQFEWKCGCKFGITYHTGKVCMNWIVCHTLVQVMLLMTKMLWTDAWLCQTENIIGLSPK